MSERENEPTRKSKKDMKSENRAVSVFVDSLTRWLVDSLPLSAGRFVLAMRRLVLLGANGMFGRDAAPVFERVGYQVVGADLPEVDIASRGSLAASLTPTRRPSW